MDMQEKTEKKKKEKKKENNHKEKLDELRNWIDE